MAPLLKGVRLLELSTVVMGPLAGQILADMGAEVIKLEALEGDIARSAPPRSGDLGALQRKLAQPTSFRGIDPVDDEPPHALGADTRSVLREHGYSDQEIDGLVDSRTVIARDRR
jgi:crotonobetainyl-CoA:carnitine CoA-transferase CaiB-like acyl-CoA transferase